MCCYLPMQLQTLKDKKQQKQIGRIGSGVQLMTVKL